MSALGLFLLELVHALAEIAVLAGTVALMTLVIAGLNAWADR